MKNTLSWFLYFLILIVGVGVSFEVWLRIKMLYIKKDPYEITMFRYVHPRINKIWNDGWDKKKIFWGPPYHVFLNRGEDNEERMETIYKYSVLPKNHDSVTPNFLRSEKEVDTSSYHVKINSLGFRSPEYQAEKEEDTFRIVALGSYPCFGSGVNNDETYSAFLESILNSQSKKKIEVWNGGQQGTTAISGLARLLKEIPEYKPDLLIWDFGWVDLYFGADFTQKKSEGSYEYPFMQELMRLVWRKGDFLVSTPQIYHFFNSGFRDELLVDWRRIYHKMARFTKEKGIPVLMLRQRVVIVPDQEFQKIADKYDHVSFLNVRGELADALIEVSDEQKNDFWSKPNWLSESGYKKGDEIPNHLYYRVDAIQLNKYAHKYVADRIAKHVEETYLSEESHGQK